MRLVLAFSVLFALAARGEVLFEDDFDSYPDGYDLADSPAWAYFIGSGITIYDGAATTGPGNRALAAAVGATVGNDYTVGCDFTGINDADGGKVLLSLRMSAHYRAQELYYVQAYPDGGGYCLELVYELDGVPETLSGTCLQADQDTWHRLAVSAVGSGPVDFEVYFDGGLVIIHTEETFIAPAGYPGFGFDAEGAAPRLDNFVQSDGGAGVERVSFGRLKTLF
ncbi:MAG TPA: hypothetical protein ENN88_04120 [Candidatus Coatesbacteria bacterium]|nr:hypothetical protein [Candidatus Coatesbacteria bacterium]